MVTPNRIILKSRGRHEEAPADQTCYPGMLLQNNPNGNVQPYFIYGGSGPILVAKEDALRGADITQKLPSGNTIPFQVAAKGDILLMLLQKGQNVGAFIPLISGGDGTLVADAASPLYEIATPSTVVTNTTAETVFSNGSYTLPAGSLLAPGDVLRLSGTVNVLSQNGTDTQQIKVYLGAISTTLLDFTALNLAAGSVVNWALEIRLTVTGATGKIVGTGTYAYGIPGSLTEATFSLASTTIDTTATQLIKASATCSAASTADQVQLVQFLVSLQKEGAFAPIVTSQEAINNSSGTGTSGFNSAAFIRCMVN